MNNSHSTIVGLPNSQTVFRSWLVYSLIMKVNIKLLMSRANTPLAWNNATARAPRRIDFEGIMNQRRDRLKTNEKLEERQRRLARATKREARKPGPREQRRAHDGCFYICGCQRVALGHLMSGGRRPLPDSGLSSG